MVVECPQCGTAELLDEEILEIRSKLEVECSQCQHRYSVRIPDQGKGPATGASERPAMQHSGITTVIEVRTRLPEGKKVALVAMKGPAKGSVYPISKPEVTVGRAGVDLIVPDHQVSGKHCSLEVRDTTAILRDLDSTNGVYVGTKQIKSARLEHLSEFRIGSTTLMFTVTDLE